ncbi:MAG: mechanosensitive ion channel family protein [Gemmatimonadota bacterium]
MATEIWGNTILQWLMAAGEGVAIFVVLRLVRRAVVTRLATLAMRTSNRFDDMFVEVLRHTHDLSLAIAALWAVASSLEVPPGIHAALRVILILIMAVQLALWSNAAIAVMLGLQAERVQAEDPARATTLAALGLAARLVVYILILVLALDNLGFNVSTLVAGLGIGGVAIALATQNILGDLLASLSIVLDKPFVVGDFIIVGELMGSVDHIGLKTTRVRSLSGEQLIFANADLLGSRIRNFKRMAERRAVFSFGVTYQTPYAALARIPASVKEIVTAEVGVRFDRAHFKTYDDSALTFEVVDFALDAACNRFMDIQQRINFAWFQRFEREGVEFAYPTRTVYVRPEPRPGAKEAAYQSA